MNPNAVSRNPYGRPMTEAEIRAEHIRRCRETGRLRDAIVAQLGERGWRAYLLEKRQACRAGRPYHAPVTSASARAQDPTLF